MKEIILAEPLHKVIQGEGKNVNVKMVVARVFGCPIQCVGCDSSHTFDRNSLSTHKVSTAKFIEELIKVLRSNINHVMFTGGEPALYIDSILEIMNELDSLKKSQYYNYSMNYDFETTGVFSVEKLRPFFRNITFNFSPKIGALKSEKEFEWKGLAPSIRPDNYIVKIVSSEETWDKDVLEIIALQKKYDIPDEKIYLMPLGTGVDDIVKNSQFLIEKSLNSLFQFTSRQHILLYGNKKLV